MSAYQSVKWRWAVRALNPRLETDKKAIDHMKAGICYFFLDEITPYGNKPVYVVGYKHFSGSLSVGSEWADKKQIERLDELDRIRYHSYEKK